MPLGQEDNQQIPTTNPQTAAAQDPAANEQHHENQESTASNSGKPSAVKVDADIEYGLRNTITIAPSQVQPLQDGKKKAGHKRPRRDPSTSPSVPKDKPRDPRLAYERTIAESVERDGSFQGTGIDVHPSSRIHYASSGRQFLLANGAQAEKFQETRRMGQIERQAAEDYYFGTQCMALDVIKHLDSM